MPVARSDEPLTTFLPGRLTQEGVRRRISRQAWRMIRSMMSSRISSALLQRCGLASPFVGSNLRLSGRALSTAAQPASSPLDADARERLEALKRDYPLFHEFKQIMDAMAPGLRYN